MVPTPNDIAEIIAYFRPHCREVSTLSKLQVMVTNEKLWREGHSLFSRIRDKTLKADRRKDEHLQHQYSLEEICAKTLFNMSNPQEPYSSRNPAPFDDDSPEHVGRIAYEFATFLGLSIPKFIVELATEGEEANLKSDNH